MQSDEPECWEWKFMHLLAEMAEKDIQWLFFLNVVQIDLGDISGHSKSLWQQEVSVMEWKSTTAKSKRDGTKGYRKGMNLTILPLSMGK